MNKIQVYGLILLILILAAFAGTFFLPKRPDWPLPAPRTYTGPR